MIGSGRNAGENGVWNLNDAVSALIAERDENSCRKDFTPSEAVAIGKALEELEREEAKKRQGMRTDLPKHSGKFPECFEAGQARDKVGEAVGMSGKTYEKAKAVVEAAEAEPEKFGPILASMDEKGKVDPAYQAVRAVQAQRQEEVEAAEDVEDWDETPEPTQDESDADMANDISEIWNPATDAAKVCFLDLAAADIARLVGQTVTLKGLL